MRVEYCLPRMETRKVQITGKSTYVISLPKKWVNKVKVVKGDPLSIRSLSDGTLLLNPNIEGRAGREEKIIITLDSKDEDKLVRKFIGAYLSGFDVIEVRGKMTLSKEVKRRIKDLTYKTIGPEIIEETHNSVIVKDLLDAGDFSLAKGLRRMYLIARGMHLDALDALLSKDKTLANDVEARDDEVDKFYWMIGKQYNLILRDVFLADKMAITSRQALGFLLTAKSIERIGDHAKRIAVNSKRVEEDLDIISDIRGNSKEIIELLDNVMDAFDKNRFDDLNDVLNRSRAIAKGIDDLRTDLFKLSAEPTTIVSLTYIVDSLNRTLSYAKDIAETSINHYYTRNF